MTRESYKKHKELIEAWLDGATIEYKDASNNWIELEEMNWGYRTEYRIKAKDETLYEWMVQYQYGEWQITDTLYTEQDAKEEFKSYKGYKQTGRSWKL